MSEVINNLPLASRGRRIGRNAGWNLLALTWASLVTLVATPIIVHRLGAEAYGVLTMLAIVTNYVWFMDLGLGQATVKYVAEHAAVGDWESVRRVFWTSASTYLVLGVLGAALMILVAPLCVYRWFSIPQGLQEPALQSFYIGALGALFGLMSYAPSSLMRGIERFDVVNKINIFAGTSQPLITILLLVSGKPLPAIIAGNIAVAAVTLLVSTWAAFALVPKLGRPVWDLPTFRITLRFGSYLSASSLIVPLLLNFEKFLLAGGGSIAAVTYYMVPHNVASRLSILPGSISNALFPTFSSLQASGEIARVADLNRRINRSVMMLLFPLVLLPLSFAKPLLSLWLGNAFAEQSAAALQILLIATLINGLAWTPHFLVQALGYPQFTFRMFVAELVICVPIAFVAVRSWGVEGAAIAWLVRATLDAVLVWHVTGTITGVRFPLWRLFADPQVGMMLLGGLLVWAGRGVATPQAAPLHFISLAVGLLLLTRSAGVHIWNVRAQFLRPQAVA